MGNEVVKDTGQEHARFFANYAPLRKDFPKIIGKQVELFKPRAPRNPEDAVLFMEYQFVQGGMTDKGGQAEVDRLKGMLNIRKSFNARSIASLVWVNFKQMDSMCGSTLIAQLAFEHSEMTLARYITDSKQTRSSLVKMNSLYTPSPRLASFLVQIAQGMAGYRANGLVHGFVCPEAILMFNVISEQPTYKLIDVSMLSHYPKFSHQRL